MHTLEIKSKNERYEFTADKTMSVQGLIEFVEWVKDDCDRNVVYSYDKLVEIAMGTLGVELLEAIEYVYYNIVNSLCKESGPKVIYGTDDAGWKMEPQ